MNQTELQSIFTYSGKDLVWKTRLKYSRATIGDIVGTINKHHGYSEVRIKKHHYYIHRLVYTYHYGDIPKNMHIDHIDGNRANNSIINLRLVTKYQNSLNLTKAKGYCWSSTMNRWRAYIVVKGKQVNLGYFTETSEARSAYLEAKKVYHKI